LVRSLIKVVVKKRFRTVKTTLILLKLVIKEFYQERTAQRNKVAELLVYCFDNFKLMELDNPQLSKKTRNA
jgi:uncharacterized protein YbbC (DUF1343 family)